MMCHISASPNHNTKREVSLSFRCATAMMGCMGIQADISKWDDKELKHLKDRITEYKSIRHIVQFGDLYRCASPYTCGTSVITYVTKDKKEAVVMAFVLTHYGMLEKVPVKGLNPGFTYTYEEKGNIIKKSGTDIMKEGIAATLKNPQDNAVIKITADR